MPKFDLSTTELNVHLPTLWINGNDNLSMEVESPSYFLTAWTFCHI